MTTPEVLYRLIPLTQGQWATVDATDYDWLMQWKWFSMWNPVTKTFYAVCSQIIDGRRQNVRMNRLVLGLEKGDKRHGDHISRDTLDNRRSNLRIATREQNMRNRKKHRNNTTGFKGVHRCEGKFVAAIRANGKRIYLGFFPTAEEAYAAYCEAAKKYHGEFARLA